MDEIYEYNVVFDENVYNVYADRHLIGEYGLFFFLDDEEVACFKKWDGFYLSYDD